ncbi:MAG: hypothetical protein JW904_08010 [Spirochaetales bacterium]|nr:hypothetical protein [Spirochaetales bacterium]
MKMKFFLVSILIVLVCFSAQALEKQKGSLKLILHEGQGRFSLYATAMTPDETLIPLFVDDDPRTSSLSVLFDNTIYKMGENSKFVEKVVDAGDGAKFIWTSPLLKITEEFSFLEAGASPLQEGLKIVITVENKSEQNAQIGVRMLFDTILGEKSDTHFMTDTTNLVAREALLKGPSMSQFWISPLINSSRGDGLLVLTDATYVTLPDEIIFANWKRLVEASWSYTVNSTKGFSFHPYSFNDSAVSQYYDPLMVKKGESRQVVLVLGNSSSFEIQKSSYIAKTDGDKQTGTQEDKANIADSASGRTEGSSGAILKNFTRGNYDVIQGEVAYINQLIQEMNKKIALGEKVTGAELERYRLMVKEIQSRAQN